MKYILMIAITLLPHKHPDAYWVGTKSRERSYYRMLIYIPDKIHCMMLGRGTTANLLVPDTGGQWQEVAARQWV